MAALGRLPEALSGLDAALYHRVHDELTLEAAPEDAEVASQALCQAMLEGFLAVFPEGETVVGEVEVKIPYR